MKKLISVFLVVIMVISGAGAMAAERLDIKGGYAIVVDYDTGYVIYEKNADVLRAPASMTKVMSLYTVLRHMEDRGLTVNAKVTITDSEAELSRTAGLSNVPLDAGETLTIDTLIRACCVVSGNAAMVALGRYIGGSEESFVRLMNDEADRLGLKAEFDDASGLSENNRITPRSMAQLCRTIISEYPVILDYTSLKSFSFKGKTYSATNTVLEGLANGYPGTDGLKTGYTGTAGYCISVTSRRGNQRIVAVVMGCPNMASRASDGYALLRYGFRNVEETMEQLFDINGTTVRNGNYVAVTLSDVPKPFTASLTWLVDGEIADAKDSVLIDNGAVLGTRLPPGETELIISVGHYNINIGVE